MVFISRVRGTKMQVGGSFQGQSARARRRVTPPKEKSQRGDLLSDAGLRDCAVFLRGGRDRTPAPSPAAVCRLPAATSCLLITLKVNEGPRGSCCRRGVRAPPPGEPAGVSTWVSFPGHTREDGAS